MQEPPSSHASDIPGPNELLSSFPHPLATPVVAHPNDSESETDPDAYALLASMAPSPAASPLSSSQNPAAVQREVSLPDPEDESPSPFTPEQSPPHRDEPVAAPEDLSKPTIEPETDRSADLPAETSAPPFTIVISSPADHKATGTAEALIRTPPVVLSAVPEDDDDDDEPTPTQESASVHRPFTVESFSKHPECIVIILLNSLWLFQFQDMNDDGIEFQEDLLVGSKLLPRFAPRFSGEDLFGPEEEEDDIHPPPDEEEDDDAAYARALAALEDDEGAGTQLHDDGEGDDEEEEDEDDDFLL